jgi:phosphohistidine swiveling domain-containing protein
MPITFSTKAGTLKSLQGILSTARIAPLVFFQVSDWQADQGRCLKEIDSMIGTKHYIVRSSCKREDSETESNAGAFLSIQNVTTKNLKRSIEQVILSYGTPSPDDEVLIQPMLNRVCRSGVALSHDPSTCSPYRIINWTQGNNTTLVSGGTAATHCWQHAAQSPFNVPPEITGTISLLDELLYLFDSTAVDCEFAVTSEPEGEQLWLLQARRLILLNSPQSEQAQSILLKNIETQVSRGMHHHPFLMGQRTVYGVMPDWNPAEIIGTRPKPFALSLYRELITDSIWAYQRHNYGYRNLRSFPLMPHFFGLPYIDVRVSFNSFIPADLDDKLSGRLVDYYVGRLLDEPTLHDKVEFEIVFSCYTLDLPAQFSKLAAAGFSQTEQDELAQSLRTLTNRVMHPDHGLWREDAKKLDILDSRREEILSSQLDPAERIYWLLEDAKRYGTLPFAGLARVGFIAIQMLRSLLAVSIITKDDYEAFLRSVSTVSGELSNDRSHLDKQSFFRKYGHLRPGTYDILSMRYDESPEQYFDWNTKPSSSVNDRPFSFTAKQEQSIGILLKQHGLKLNTRAFFDFLQSGIKLRELAKFKFTRNLSDALSLAIEHGQSLGISREDLAYANINAFKEIHVSAVNQKELLQDSICAGKKRYLDTLSISLPPIIVNPSDVWTFGWPDSSPNFITQKQVVANVSPNCNRDEVEGKIVCIPNADPGYDWLFSYSIAGLITAWGGCNSHMAIRAAEQGLPTIVGVGEKNFNLWSKAERLHIDCSNRRVEIL